jgi:two-component system, chemotaxis family, sensor kinase CheA
MGTREHELLRKLLATFMVEAKERLGAMSSALVALEHAGPPQEQAAIVEAVFREAHSLKGAARAVNLPEIEGLCQSLETEFSDLKERHQAPLLEQLDGLHRMVDALAGILAEMSGEAVVATDVPLLKGPGGAGAQSDISAGKSVPRPAPSVDVPHAPRGPRAPTAVPDERLRIAVTVRTSALKLDSLLREAEELIPARAAGSYRLDQLREIHSSLLSWEEEWKGVRPQARALQRFLNGQASGREKPKAQFSNVLSLLLENENALHSIRTRLAALRKNLERDGRALDRRVTDLVTDAKRMSMLPFSALLEAFPKLVRDLCRDYGKHAELFLEGSDIEADRRILEEIKDPLMHMVRNCIDHGVEAPDARSQRGKPEKASIAIRVSPQAGGRVEIVVSDDGAGIDVRNVRTAAISMGLVSEAKGREMNDQEVLALVFQSGLSTSPMITEVSGRGLGLAIVREKVERLGGSVSLETEPGARTAFRLLLPLTMATLRGILVRSGGHVFALPSMHVQRVLRVDRDEVKSVENREAVQVGGRLLSLVRLSGLLEPGDQAPEADVARRIPAVLLAWGGEQMVVTVSEVLREQQIVVKSLGKQLVRVRNIQGATILGNGKVAAVLNVADLFRSASTASNGVVLRDERKPKSILVAEDSITARTLLQSILESAGYSVKSAADGAEAFGLLQAQRFDLLVSDVDMPKLNGFDLTAKLRRDRTLSELPVVLVTGLDSAADKERGLEVGANAYIVKSSFDQSNLMDAVRRLI